MKHPYLCAFLTVALSFTAYQPGFRLNAAELWNSTGTGPSAPSYYINKEGGQKNKPGAYYNVLGGMTDANERTLYNVKDPSIIAANQKQSSLLAVMHAYDNVDTEGRQRQSKQYGYMSADAVANRQADVDHALQIEYETRQRTAREMAKVQEEVAVARYESDKARQEELSAKEAQKQKEALEREQQKANALSGRKGAYRSSKSRSGGARYTARSASSKTGLKKPTRLFNDPNK